MITSANTASVSDSVRHAPFSVEPGSPSDRSDFSEVQTPPDPGGGAPPGGSLPSLAEARVAICELDERAEALGAQFDVMREKFEVFDSGIAPDLAEWVYLMKQGAFRQVLDARGRPCKTLATFLSVWLRLPGDASPEVLKQKRNRFDYLVRRWAESLPEAAETTPRRHRPVSRYAHVTRYFQRHVPALTPEEKNQLARVVWNLCDRPALEPAEKAAA